MRQGLLLALLCAATTSLAMEPRYASPQTALVSLDRHKPDDALNYIYATFVDDDVVRDPDGYNAFLQQLLPRLRSPDPEVGSAAAYVLARVPPGWDAGLAAAALDAERQYLYTQFIERKTNGLPGDSKSFDQALMNSAGMYLDATALEIVDETSIRRAIEMFERTRDEFPDSRYLAGSLYRISQLWMKLALLGMAPAEPIAAIAAAPARRDYVNHSIAALGDLLSRMSNYRVQDDIRFLRVRTDALYFSAIASFLIGDTDLASERLRAIAEHPLLKGDDFDHIYVDSFLRLSFDTDDTEAERYTVKRSYVPQQLSIYTECVLDEVSQAGTDNINFDRLNSVLSAFQNSDYRIYFASMRDPAAARRRLKQFNERLSQAEVKQGITAVFAAYREEIEAHRAAIETACVVEPLDPGASLRARLREPTVDGGYYGIWIGGNLSYDLGRRLIATLEKHAREFSEAYLARPVIKG